MVDSVAREQHRRGEPGAATAHDQDPSMLLLHIYLLWSRRCKIGAHVTLDLLESQLQICKIPA
jgi:hypothetical protein